LSWQNRRTQLSRKHEVSNESPLQGRSCHVDSVNAGTQTCSRQSIGETYADAAPPGPPRAPGDPPVSKRPSKASDAAASQPEVNARFHVKPVRLPEAATNAAEHRWNRALCNLYAGRADELAVLIEAIDDALREAATHAEQREHGQGLQVILRAVRSKPRTRGSA
jgi:hypothetical protein